MIPRSSPFRATWRTRARDYWAEALQARKSPDMEVLWLCNFLTIQEWWMVLFLQSIFFWTQWNQSGFNGSFDCVWLLLHSRNRTAFRFWGSHLKQSGLPCSSDIPWCLTAVLKSSRNTQRSTCCYISFCLGPWLFLWEASKWNLCSLERPWSASCPRWHWSAWLGQVAAILPRNVPVSWFQPWPSRTEVEICKCKIGMCLHLHHDRHIAVVSLIFCFNPSHSDGILFMHSLGMSGVSAQVEFSRACSHVRTGAPFPQWAPKENCIMGEESTFPKR